MRLEEALFEDDERDDRLTRGCLYYVTLECRHAWGMGATTVGDKDAAIYCRISDDREGERLGVERQEEDCRAYASRHNLNVIDVFIDDDIGASDYTSKKRERVKYNEMLRRARAGEFKTIISYTNSRLTRRLREYLDLIDLYTTHGVVIRTLNSGEHDLATADGRAAAITVATWDAAEAERISERVRRAILQKVHRGEPGVQHRRHFGYEKDGKSIVPAEAALIRKGVDDILKGASITQIWREWEAKGVLTADGNAKWAWTPVHRALLDWRVAGVRAYKGEPIEGEDGEYLMGKWEPIITIHDRARAIEMLKKRSRRGQRQGRWLLSGLVRCGLCARPMYGALGAKPEQNRYLCSHDGRSHLSVTAPRLENYVERVVYRYILDKAMNDADAIPDQPAKPWPGEERLATVARKISELMGAFNRDELPGSIAFPQVEKLERERKSLRSEADLFYSEQVSPKKVITSRDEALRLYRNFHEETFEARQLALSQEIERVVVSPGQHGYAGRSYEAFKDRVKIHWVEPHPEFNGRSAEEAAEDLLLHLRLPDEEPYSPPTDVEMDALVEQARRELEEEGKLP